EGTERYEGANIVSMSMRTFVMALAVAGVSFIARPQSSGTLQPPQTPAPQTQTPQPPAPQTPGPQPTAPCPALTSMQIDDAKLLLGRIGDAVNQALKSTPAIRSAAQPPATAGSGDSGQQATVKVSRGTANTVAIPRDRLQEILAEVDQLK